MARQWWKRKSEQKKGRPALTGQPPETNASTPSRMPAQGDCTTAAGAPPFGAPPFGAPPSRRQGQRDAGAPTVQRDAGAPTEPLSRALAYLAGCGVAVVRVAYQRGQAPVIEVGNGRQTRRLYGEHTGIQHRDGQTLHRFEAPLYGCTVCWLADPGQPHRPLRGLAAGGRA